MDLPASLMTPYLQDLDSNDTIPSVIDPSKISYLGEFLILSTSFVSDSRTAVKWWQTGTAHSFHSHPIPDTDVISDQVWTTVETVLIRLNTSFTPSGRFPVYSNESVTDANGVETRIGYDAAVCVEMHEPWIIEAYNTSVGSPTTLRIDEKGYRNTSLPSGKIQGDPIQNTRYLNTTGKNLAFVVAHDNSINQMLKDNGRDFFYVPSPTVGPVTLTYHNFQFELPDRLFLSLMALDLRDTPNYPQTDSPLSAPESMRLTFCHTLRGLGPSSHNHIRMRHSHMSLMCSGR